MDITRSIIQSAVCDTLDMFASSSSSTDPLAVLHDLSRVAQHSPVLSNISKNYGGDRSAQRFYLLVHDVAREGPDLDR
jgi:hypothetical protein